jgi:hypothetical protein
VRHTRDQDADRREALLPNHLLLQRLQLLAHPALVIDLRRDRRAGALQIRDHARHGLLQMFHLGDRHRPGIEWRQITAADAPGRLVEMIERANPSPCEHPGKDDHENRGAYRDGKVALINRQGP